MAFNEYEPAAPEEGGKKSHGEMLVEGYVVEHGVVWKKSNSVAGYLNLDAVDTAVIRRPPPVPKVSVTLSEYLTASSPHPDPTADFGWFTPTASVSSGLAGEGCTDAYLVPSPSHHASFSFGTPARMDSTAKTASLSPVSVFGDGGDGGNGRGGSGGRSGSSSSQRAAVGAGAATAGSGKTGEVRFHTNGSISSTQKGWHQQQGHATEGEGGELLAMSSNGSGGTTMGLRLLPVSRASSTTTHVNSWHTLYRDASDSGRLSSQGRCTMHLRRDSFLISTRNFPEKPPTPRAWGIGGGGGGGGGWRDRRSGANAGHHALLTGPQQRTAVGVERPPESAGQTKDDYGGGGGGHRLRQKQQQQEYQQAGVKPKSYSWALTEIRICKGRAERLPPLIREPAHAEYLVVVCVERDRLVAGWRRHKDFERLAKVARESWMPKANAAWKSLELARRRSAAGPCSIPLVMRPRRLDAVYLQNKARFLEEFLKQFFFEANSKDALLSFLDTRRPATMQL